MKPIRATFIYFFVYAVIVFIWAFMMYGCSAEYHMKKAVKKGYSFTMATDTITISHIDSFKVVTRDTIYWVKYEKQRDSIIYFPQIQYYPRWKVRFDTRRFNDSLKFIRSIYVDSMRNALKSQKNGYSHDIKSKKQDTKVVRSENKNGFSDSMKWIAMIILLLIIAYVLFRYEPKQINQ